jgi:uncharacterized protein involved in tolerance to divalent cations
MADQKQDAGLAVFVTAGDAESARRIAGALVESRLAACVNVVGGIRSIYRWEGKIADDEESLLIIKTWSDRFEELKRKVLEVHAYDVPEIVGIPLAAGHAAYLEWLFKETH